jgi:O-antigen ligase
VVRPSVDGALVGFGRKAVAWLVLASAVAVSIFVVRHPWSPTALTGRPALWHIASDYIHRSPWFGYGPTRWATLYDSSEIPQAAQRSTHNLWLDVLFVAGAIGVVLLVIAIIAMLVSAGHARTGVVLSLATIVMVGSTEGVWAVGTFDFLSFSFIAMMLTGRAPLPQTATASAEPAAQRRLTARQLSYPRIS